MKRSEMVTKLEMSVSILSGGMLTKKEIRSEANALLRIIENAGMIPPQTYILKNTHPIEGAKVSTLVNEWESE